MNIRANILLRVYLSFGLIVLFAVAVLVRLCDVQFVEGEKWRAMADSLSTKYINVEAAVVIFILMMEVCWQPLFLNTNCGWMHLQAEFRIMMFLQQSRFTGAAVCRSFLKIKHLKNIRVTCAKPDRIVPVFIVKTKSKLSGSQNYTYFSFI